MTPELLEKLRDAGPGGIEEALQEAFPDGLPEEILARVAPMIDKLIQLEPGQALEGTPFGKPGGNFAPNGVAVEGGIPKTNEDRVQRFLRARKRNVSGAWGRESSNIVNSGVNHSARKSGAVVDWRGLKAISADDLVVDATHKGSYFFGRISTASGYVNFAGTVVFLVEDFISKEIVEVCGYNVPDLRNVGKTFSVGRPVAIAEPFYKLRADGTPGIRFDSIADCDFIRNEPRTLVAWNELAKELVTNPSVKAGRDGEHPAAYCYRQALEACSNEAKFLATLHTNIATCEWQLANPVGELRHGLMALGLDSSVANPKPLMRVVIAVAQLDVDLHRSVAKVAGERFGSGTVQRLSKEGLEGKQVSSQRPAAGGGALALPGMVQLLVKQPQDLAQLARDKGKGKGARGTGGKQQTAADVKEFAKKLYLSGRHADAADHYEICYSLYAEEVASEVAAPGPQVADWVAEIGVALREQVGLAMKAGKYSDWLLLQCAAAVSLDPRSSLGWIRYAQLAAKISGKPATAIEFLKKAADDIPQQPRKDADHSGAVGTAEQSDPGGWHAGMHSLRTELLAEIQSLQKAAAAGTSAKPVSAETTQQRKARNPVPDVLDPVDLPDELDFLDRLSALFTMGGSKALASILGENLKFLATRPVPNVSLEFATNCPIPAGLDAANVQQAIAFGYRTSKANPQMHLIQMLENTWHLSPREVMKRFHGTDALEWLLEQESAALHPGLVLRFMDDLSQQWEEGKAPRLRYSGNIRSSFGNNPNQSEIMHLGTTHVAVGFNDLGVLVGAQLQAHPAAEFVGRPLRFVGLELNSYSVAKTKVIVQLIVTGSVSPTLIVQCWLSSTWTRDAVTAFKRAAAQVLSEDRSLLRKGNEEVRSYISTWVAAEPRSGNHGRRAWFTLQVENKYRCFMDTLNFKRQVDRLAHLNYSLTGEVAVSEGEFASLAMFNVPAGAPFMIAESVFAAISGAQIGQLVQQAIDRDPVPGVLELMVARFEKKFAEFRKMMHREELQIEVHHCEVSANWEVPCNIGRHLLPDAGPKTNGAILDLISSLYQPYTMSWSNVQDYMPPRAFHASARRCSAHGEVVHSGYSINWAFWVYGTSVTDYMDCTDMYPVMVDDGGFVRKLMEQACGEVIQFNAKLLSLDTIFHSPPFDTPLNIGHYILAVGLHKHWTNYWFGEADVEGRKASLRKRGLKLNQRNSGLQVGCVAPGTLFGCNRVQTPVCMNWTYDQELRLQKVSGGDQSLPAGLAEEASAWLGHLSHGVVP